jgi:hypothetical protein
MNEQRVFNTLVLKTSDVSKTSDVWENQQSFYNQSFVQQWIAEAEKGEQGAV